MQLKTSFLPLALLLGVVGCFDDSSTGGGSSLVSAPDPAILSTAPRLNAWADTAKLSMPEDSNLATATWYDRWDSVVNFDKYQSQTRANIKAIAADWASRHPVVSVWSDVKSFAGNDTMGYHGSLTQVQFSVDGIPQGGFVWMPKTAQTSPVPVILFGHPGDDGLSKFFMDLLLSYLLDTTFANRVAIVAPAYRGEDATAIGGTTITSPSSARSPWDRDVDDALAMLNETLRRNPSQLDPSRITAIGYSRGAGVSLLASLRDARIQSVFEIAGPTDFFAPSIQRLSMSLLAGQTADLPGLNELNSQLLQPFGNRSISADSLRHALLQRSAARLALSGLLPTSTAVHGSADSTVYPDQSTSLHKASTRVTYLPIAGMTHSSFFSDTAQLSQVRSALQGFLRTQLNLP